MKRKRNKPAPAAAAPAKKVAKLHPITLTLDGDSSKQCGRLTALLDEDGRCIGYTFDADAGDEMRFARAVMALAFRQVQHERIAK